MYSRKCSASGVNEAGKELFAQCSQTMENIPPTKAALLQHVRHAAYQLGYVWSQALVPVPVLPSPALWGWLTSDSGWKPFWTELPEASTACYEHVHCGCKKGCRRQCKWRSLNLQSTELCKCIIIIMAGMAVFNVAGYLIEERRRWPVNYRFPTRTMF